MIKRVTYKLRKGDVLIVQEYHDGKYGAKGLPRKKKKKATKEDIARVNKWNKTKRCQMRLLEYFEPNDLLVTWTYKVANRPATMKEAKKHFKEAMRKVRREIRKRGYENFYMRNIERGTKGAWHIHFVVKEVGDTASIVQNAWDKGGTWLTKIKDSDYYGEDMLKLAEYLTKDEHTTETKKDGTKSKPRIKESDFHGSQNMPLPKPHPDKLYRWKKEIKPKKGYYIARMWEGINPKTGYKYRRYTMIKLNRRI